MAKDNSPGLLSKVAKFVRNPTKDWTELDQQEPEQADSGYSKQALKEMIERKRQNDFVRKREFDHLRKLRRREPTAISEQDAGRPSFFQSSLPSNPDERATTLKKIDEIEAQMSKQWWKGKQADAGSSTNFPVSTLHGGASDSVPSSRTPPSQSAGKDSRFAITEPSTLNPDLAPDMLGQEFAPTQLVSSLYANSSQVPSSTPASMGSRSGGGRQPPAPVSRMTSGFSNSQLFATELGDGGTDPDLEEAAIRFANGDDLGAEAGLMDALRGDNISQESADVWMSALFDLYRATNQKARFDSVGLDFAQRFGRSPPAWFSMPDLVGLKNGAPVGGTVAAARTTTWDCPAELNMMAVIDLRQALRQSPMPWRLNWSRLRAIQPDAGAELGGLFAQWCTQTVSLSFEGPGNLEKVLRAFTPSGDKSVPQNWWQMLMDALRVMRLQDEFELVALDYCVTYEVSPPAWQDARCEYRQEGSEARIHNQFSDTQPFLDGLDDRPGVAAEATAPMGMDGLPPVRLELSGEIMGDAAPALEKLEAARHSSERLVVSCAKLIRVDFSAAGSILNWVAQRQNEGCQVQFREVHRLVAAFFNVIGISEHARIVPRSG
jgi:ABC-type transporter Mla MlaB component